VRLLQNLLDFAVGTLDEVRWIFRFNEPRSTPGVASRMAEKFSDRWLSLGQPKRKLKAMADRDRLKARFPRPPINAVKYSPG
jgi:hypothetical protein